MDKVDLVSFEGGDTPNKINNHAECNVTPPH